MENSSAAPTSSPPREVSQLPTASPTPARKASKKPFLYLGIAVAVVLLGVGIYLFATRNHQSTDDAQLDADVIPVAPRVGGPIVKVDVQDNQLVKAGQTLIEIDPADYQAHLKEAEADLALAQAQALAAHAQQKIVEASATGGFTTAKAALSGSSAGVTSAQAQIEAAQAALVRAQADQHKAEQDLTRAKTLYEQHAIAQDKMDAAQATFDTTNAQLEGARAQLAAARDQRTAALTRVTEAQGRLGVAKPIEAQVAAAQAQAEAADARAQSAQAALDLAKLQLQYTKVVASVDGVVSRVKLDPGQLLSAGQTIMELVPKNLYVEANFKETQIGRMRPGQKAEISVDALPGITLHGTVESLSGGTGARFSLLPPDNASGNYVKVVQRVPVRIKLDGVPNGVDLRAGLSVDVTVFED